jgi:hypothetical protein
MFSNVFPKIMSFTINVEKHGTVRQATDDNVIDRMHFTCSITKTL